jgi:integrase
MAPPEEAGAYVENTQEEAVAEVGLGSSGSGAIQSRGPEQPYIEKGPTNVRPRRPHPNFSDTGLGENRRREMDGGKRNTTGALFRSIDKRGRIWGTGMTSKVLWEIVKAAAARADIPKLAPHDLRRTCARLCHLAGGEPDQIQFLLGHVSIQTTEQYLGCKQKLRYAVNDKLGIEP